MTPPDLAAAAYSQPPGRSLAAAAPGWTPDKPRCRWPATASETPERLRQAARKPLDGLRRLAARGCGSG